MAGFQRAVVDAVEDAAQVLRAARQDTVEAEAVLALEDLARIGRADRGDPLAEVDAGLQVADPAVELHRLDVQHVARQADLVERPDREDALERQVVNREHDRHAADDGSGENSIFW